MRRIVETAILAAQTETVQLIVSVDSTSRETGGLIGGLDSLSGAMAYWGQDGKSSRALNIVAAILAAILAGLKTADHVSKQKFCEKCSAYMVSKILGLSSWQEAQRVAVAHWQKDFTALKNLLRVGLGPCETTLHACPRCCEGFVESMAKFSWSDKSVENNDKVDDTWLFASTKVVRNDVRVLR